MKLANKIGRTLFSIKRAQGEQLRYQEGVLENLEKLLPSGAGIDYGTKIVELNERNEIVLVCDYHHMNESGYYTHWSTYEIRVANDWFGLDVDVMQIDDPLPGDDTERTLDYLSEVYLHALELELE